MSASVASGLETLRLPWNVSPKSACGGVDSVKRALRTERRARVAVSCYIKAAVYSDIRTMPTPNYQRPINQVLHLTVVPQRNDVALTTERAGLISTSKCDNAVHDLVDWSSDVGVM